MAHMAAELLGMAVEYQRDDRSDESFVHCLICDEWEGHKEWCFIERLEAWSRALPTEELKKESGS
jgi:hypothetical protein